MRDADLAGAMADTSRLSDFEGLPVRQVGIEIPDRFAADHAATSSSQAKHPSTSSVCRPAAANEEQAGG